jgi:hypothetical protein
VAVALAGPTVHLFDAATGVNLLEPSRAAA